MPQLKESENGDLQFQWGKRRGLSGANKDVQFYESFIYDEENYSLYDDVYLFKEDDSEPYVGKILKIWEQPKRKRRVKILWFFRPNDISHYLDGHASSEKELFMASGKGVGLFNVNPLEAIAGRCSVICTNRDSRNPQPSSTEIEQADFIFSRFFDVGTCTVLERPPDEIAEVELKLLLNHPKEKPDVKQDVSDGDNQDVDTVQAPKLSSQTAEIADVKINTSDILPQKPNAAALLRSRWFADMPWKARIEKAHSQGKLMFLDNLDPSYSASEIEDLMREALNLECTVKVIPQVAFQNPQYGQAYVICNTRNEATNAVQEMDEKCLILSDGRPVCAKLGMIELPQKAAKFPGHLKVDKGRLQPTRIEHKNAVATSHCSQPNTIEYELALDWLLLFEKYRRSKEKLFKKQRGQLRVFISKYTDK